MTNIKIITGSVRPGRFNIQAATWMYEFAKKREDIDVELLDLATINLPFYDEVSPPKQNQYEKQHTKDWSTMIKPADGFILVTPEYNHSYSPVLKNALDYLFYEWNHKPVAYMSYGSQAGGSRAIEHLRTIAAELKMYDLQEHILLSNYWEQMDEKGAFIFTSRHEEQATALLNSLVFWAKTMKKAREILRQKEIRSQ